MTTDLNGDGEPDLIVANHHQQLGVGPAEHDSTGRHHRQLRRLSRPSPPASNPDAVATTDLNGDGRPDLIVANLNSNTVSVLLNTTAPGAATASFADPADLRHRQQSRLGGDDGPERRRKARPHRRQSQQQLGVGAAEHDSTGRHHRQLRRLSRPSPPAAIPLRWWRRTVNGDGRARPHRRQSTTATRCRCC